MRRTPLGVWALAFSAALGAGAAVFALTQPASASSKSHPKTRVVVVTGWSGDGWGFREITVNGRRCIESYDTGESSSISRDWGAK